MNHMTQHDHQQMTEPHEGKSMFGMHAGHDQHAGHSVAMFRDKFWLSFVLTIPVVFWSADIQHYSVTAEAQPKVRRRHWLPELGLQRPMLQGMPGLFAVRTGGTSHCQARYQKVFSRAQRAAV